MSEVLIHADSVSKKFCRSLKRSLWYGLRDMTTEALGREGSHDTLRRDEFWAVNDVSFKLHRGECLGLIGHNGAGKTTLLKLLNGLIKPDHGSITMRGRVGALIALGAGFNPVLTGRENIYVNGSVLGLTKSEIDAKINDIIDFAEIREFIDSPVQSYSSGMQVRLGFAVATALEPDILLLDEVLAVGDAPFQAKCHQRLGAVLRNAAVILVSHQMWHIRKICDSGLLLDRGRVSAFGRIDAVIPVYTSMQTVTEAPQRIMFAHPHVKQGDARLTETVIPYGGFLTLNISLDLDKSLNCDSALLNIVDLTETVHAQVNLRDIAGSIPRGDNRRTLRIGPVHLVLGQYSLNLVLLTTGGKENLLILRHLGQFKVDGPLGNGVAYSPYACVLETS